MAMTDLTPAMKQYVEMKALHEDCILFFRMGDFYEMFFEDAVTASKVLDLTLTTRNKNKDGSIPLCGFPYHAASTYIARLIEKGFKVAICEQMEDPKLAKGVVKRDVVRVVTPGLVVEPDNLDAKENNFLAAVYPDKGRFGLAFIDISTGEFRVADLDDKDFLPEIAALDFREIILPERFREQALQAIRRSSAQRRIDRFSEDYFDQGEALGRLKRYFSDEDLRALSLEDRPAVLAAAGAVLRYVEETQKDHLGHINRLQEYRPDECLILDDIAKQTLELFSTIQEGKKKGSLLHVLDQTVTAMGGRRLRWWLHYPLVNPEKIRARLNAVYELRENHVLRETLRGLLASVYDLERLGGRIAMDAANARDLNALKVSLRQLPELRQLIQTLPAPLISAIVEGIDEMPDIHDLIAEAIAEEPPFLLREGGIIREGYRAELDALIGLSKDGKKGIAALEAEERTRTGINSLKVGFNSVFGYYIEVTKANTHLVPDDYIRKQTLVNAERYINQALKDYEHAVLTAEERRRELEYTIFLDIRNRIVREVRRIQTTASCLADLDVLASLAEVAERNQYCCPTVDGGDVIDIADGRHPVVELSVSDDRFVPNDTLLDCRQNRFLIITGPNMAGKSTFIRQVALIVVLAQMGSFVPASKATIGVVDRLFTRIGASDSLSRGQSTFMVEMNEVANILRNATNRSLIVLDEVGRGTSTFDGLSIAWAVAEHIHGSPTLGARTLFATHYHQLIELAVTCEGVKNYNIAVKEWGGKIVFLRKIMPGGTSRSYGIDVAGLAGIPDGVIQRAREILHNLENGELDRTGMPKLSQTRKKDGAVRGQGQLSLFMTDDEAVIAEMKGVDVLSLSPLQALNLLSSWKDRIGGNGGTVSAEVNPAPPEQTG